MTAVDATTITFDVLAVDSGSTAGTYVAKFANPAPFDDPASGVIDNRLIEYEWSLQKDFRGYLETFLAAQVSSAVNALGSTTTRSTQCGYNSNVCGGHGTCSLPKQPAP